MVRNLIPYFISLFILTACNQKELKTTDDNINKGELASKNFFFATNYENNDDSAIIVLVTINGKKRRFLFDTGAGSAISTSLQEECNFPLLQEASLNDSNGDTSTIKIISISELLIGDIKFKDIPALIFDMNAFPFDCDKLDGIIGSNLLRLLIVQVNTQKNEVVFTDDINKLKLNPIDGFDFYTDNVQSDPTFPVKIDKNVVDTIQFDTGDKSFYIISRKKFESFNRNNLFGKNIVAQGTGISTMGILGNNQFSSKSFLLSLDSFNIAKYNFHNVVAGPTNGARSRIGRGLLNYAVITMDYPKRKFYINPIRTLVCDTIKSFGINYTEFKGKLVIATVWENTEAFKRGIKPGSEIIQFGNFKPALINKCLWTSKLRKEADTDRLLIVYIDERNEKKEILLRRKIIRR